MITSDWITLGLLLLALSPFVFTWARKHIDPEYLDASTIHSALTQYSVTHGHAACRGLVVHVPLRQYEDLVESRETDRRWSTTSAPIDCLTFMWHGYSIPVVPDCKVTALEIRRR